MVQLQLLNKILKDKDASIIILNNLNDSYFSDNKAEFKFIEEHINKYGQVPDMESFLSVFPNFIVIDVHENTNYLLEKLYRDRNIRYLAESYNQVAKKVKEGDVEAANEIYKKIYDELTEATSMSCIDITKDTSRFSDYIEKVNNYDKFYISTGFKELDLIIGGWDRQEELATIIARTNVGKSWCLLKCAAAAVEQGLTVGLYSGEMTPRKVGYRFDTLVNHISNKSLVRGNEDVRNDYKKYIESLPTRFPGALKILHPTMINGQAGVNALRAFIKKENLDILFIDQHSLLEDDRHAKNPVEKAANISKDLKNLQVMSGIPIIAVSQQNREKRDDGVIDTTMIAQSDRIGQDSTVIIAVERKDDILKMHLLKSRDSENGKELDYRVDLNMGIFTYVPPEDETCSSYEEDYIDYIPEPMDGGNPFA